MSDGVVTTSWDDGHRLDLRLVERLKAVGLTGTFYIPRDGPEEVMSATEIRELHATGMEVGAHGLTHRPFTALDEAEATAELTGGKAWLEDILQAPVHAFCFPSGRFRRSQRRLVAQAGYRYGRTTRAFGFDLGGCAHLAPVTLQLFPHSGAIHVRHALREGNLRGIKTWAAMGAPSDLRELLARSAEQASERGSVLHVWGHSWELEKVQLWEWIDVLGDLAVQFGLRPLTNSTLVDLAL